MKRRIKRAIKTLRKRMAKRHERTSARRFGDQARERGAWGQASDWYRKHVDAAPEDFDIWVQLGHALKETGRYDEAEAAYTTAGRLRPQDADLWLMRGHLARLRGEEAAAARHYAVSASIDGNPHAAAERDRSLAMAAASWGKRADTTGLPVKRPVGAVKTIFDGHLRGWAVDPDNAHRPAAIDIFLDGELFQSIVADGPLHRGHPGAREFDLDVSAQLDLAHARRLDARLSRTGEVLDGTPLFAQIDGALAAWLTRFHNLAPGEYGRMRVRATTQTASRCLDILVFDFISASSLQMLVSLMGAQISPAWRLKVADSGHDPAFTRALVQACASDDRIVRIDAADAHTSAERLHKLIGTAQEDWILPLAAGVLPEPEMVFRLLDAASASVDMAVADVAYYGVNADSLEGFSAEPAWSSHLIDAGIRSRRLAAFRRHSAAAFSPEALSAEPLTTLVGAIGGATSAVAQIPGLLARVPVKNRNAPTKFDAPEDDGRSLVVVVEAPENLGVLGEQLDVLTADIGADGRILLVDPYPRGETARAQLKRLANLVERTPCSPESAGRTLNMTIKSAIARQAVPSSAIVVLVAPSIIPQPGAVRRLVARQAQSGAAAVAGIVMNDEGRCQGLGFIVGPGGGLAPAWVHHLPPDIPDREWRPQARSASAFDLVALSGAAFEKVGGFDPELFSVWRDIDFCLRIEHAGLGVLVDPAADATRSGPPASPSEAQDEMVRRRWSSRLSQDDPFYSPLYSAALNYAPGALSNPWLPVRISRRPIDDSEIHAMEPRLTPPPQEVAA